MALWNRRRRAPWLSTEDQGDIDDVTEPTLRQVLDDDAFGKFVILSRSDEEFMQAASEWRPSPECEAFVEQHGSDPWVLEYRDANNGAQYRAEGQLTLAQVRDAFVGYLNNDSQWQSSYSWTPIT